LAAWNDSYADRTIDILGDLVAIPSHERETEIAMYIARRLRAKGLDVDLMEVTPGRPNLVARLPGGDGQASVMLQTHMDTVPPSESNPGIRITADRISGRGACDACAAMAGMLTAVECVAESTLRSHLNVLFVGNMGEETGSIGSRVLVESGFRVDAGIVGEPTDNVIVIAHKGLVWLEISVRLAADVPSSVSRRPDPASVLARVAETLENAFAKSLSGDAHSDLGSRTLNIGTVSTRPTGENLGSLRADVRLLPGDDPAGVASLVREELANVKSEFEHYDIDVNPYRTYPPLDVSADCVLVRALSKAASSVSGESRLGVAPYCSDGGVFNAAQIPIALFGPGKIDQAHVDEEFVDLAQTRQAARVYHQFLLEFARMSS